MVIPLGLTALQFVVLASAAISFGFALAYKVFGDQATMRELKKDLKKYQKLMREHKHDAEKVKELSAESMKLNMAYMRKSMKPMMITFIPVIFIFQWLRATLSGTIIIPLSFWPGHLGWLGTYILFSLMFTTVFRKLLKVA